MDFKQLEAFAAVVDTNSFSEAARWLYLTQPTISTHIRSLESELKVKLIVRSTKSIQITKEGYRLYGYAKDILKLRQRALDELSNVQESVLHIGASTVPSAYVLPGVIAGYRNDHPEMVFDVIQTDSMDVVHKLLDNGIDIGVVGTQISSGRLQFEPLLRDEIVLATPNNAQFAALKAKNAPIIELLRFPMIMREYGSGTKKEADLLFEKLGVDTANFKIAAYTNDQQAIRSYIRQGMGVSIISHKMVEAAEQCGELLTFSLGEHIARRTLYLVTMRNHTYPGYILDFIAYLKKEMRGDGDL